MVQSADGVKISNFVKTTTVQDSDLLNVVRQKTNYAIKVENFKQGLGVELDVYNSQGQKISIPLSVS